MARIRGKQFGKFIGLVMISLIFFTSTSLFAEDFTGKIILEKTGFVVGEEFSLSILVPGIAPLMLSVEPPLIPGGIRLLKGPYMRPGKSGTVIDYYFKVEKPGRYLLGSYTLKSARKTGYTPPVFIRAGKNNFQLSGIDNVPPTVKWAVPLKKYYPGEIIPMIFIVENLESDDVYIESSIYSNNSGIVKRVSWNSEKEERIVLSKNILTGKIYDILYHNYVFVPLSSGNITLPDADVYLSKDEKSYNTFIPGINVQVEGFPSYIKNTGAIGNFSSSYTLSDSVLHPNEILVIKVKLEGTGNFYGLKIPVPYTDRTDLVEIVKLKEDLSVEPEGNWFTGSMTVRYSMKLRDNSEENISDNIELVIPDMPVMKPGSEHSEIRGSKYYTLAGGTEAIGITSEREIFTYPNLYTEHKNSSQIILSFLAAAVFILASLAAVFGIINKNRYLISFAAIIVFIIFIFLLLFIFKEKEVYGNITPNSHFSGILTVPEENSSIKYNVQVIERGLRVLVKGYFENYYLIEMPGGGEGWIIKDNIRLDDG